MTLSVRSSRCSDDYHDRREGAADSEALHNAEPFAEDHTSQDHGGSPGKVKPG